MYQMRKKRKYAREDKFLELKFDAYQSYLDKTDEMNKRLRSGADEVMGAFFRLITAVAIEDESKKEKVLNNFFSDLQEIVSAGLLNRDMLKKELNKLEVFSDDRILRKVREYRDIAEQQQDEFKQILNEFRELGDEKTETSEEDFTEVMESLQEIQGESNQSSRNKKLNTLHGKIVSMMRQEIRDYK